MSAESCFRYTLDIIGAAEGHSVAVLDEHRIAVDDFLVVWSSRGWVINKAGGAVHLTPESLRDVLEGRALCA